MRIILFVFASLLRLSVQRSTPADDSYVAAVVEYEVRADTGTNVQNYIRLTKEAADQNADVVVFPEMTLNRGNRSITVPIHGLLKEYPIPALHTDLYDDILVSISSAARDNQIYVVINVQEKMDCADAPGEECPERKLYIFNTNVVFDRTGAVIDRYRKINLFGEYTRTPALKPELGLFTTDFGVTFGHFICFDIMFQVPAVQLPQKHNLTDIIYPTMWFSEMPYLTAVQTQQAYAYTLDLNFLAAGANNVRIGSAGSGIYSGKAGALIAIMPGVPTTRVLVSRVPKVPGKVTESYPGPISDDPTEHDNLLLKTDPSLPSHRSRLLEPGSQDFILMDGTTICRFMVNLTESGDTLYKYRAGAFNGVRTFDGVANGGTRACAVFACTGDSIDTCGKRFPQYTPNNLATFEELTIEAYLPTPQTNEELEAQDVTYYPVSLQPSIQPLKSEEFTFNTTSLFGIFDIYTYSLLNKNSQLYSFGIFGRVFDRDEEEPTPPVDESKPETTTTTSAPETDVPSSSASIYRIMFVHIITVVVILVIQTLIR